jgi:hypothetical protein
MSLRLRPGSRDDQLGWLGATVLITLVVWHSPLAIVLYPFTLLATWFHEMGHGMFGLMVGAQFEQLVILPDGSGYTQTFPPSDMSAFGSALISAGGPLGPAIAGGVLIIASRWRRSSGIALMALAAALFFSTVFVVSGMTGWIVLPLLGLAILAVLQFATVRQRQFVLQFLGLQACISTYTNLGYLFSRGGVMIGGANLSDTEQMSRSLFLPYWFWGSLLTLVIAGIIAGSLWLAYRR